MEENEFKKKLEEFNQEIIQAFDNSKKNIEKKIEDAKKDLKQKVEIINLLKDKRKIPILSNPIINPNQQQNFVYNSLLNPILLMLANLKIITQFSLGNEIDKIIKNSKDLLRTITQKNLFLGYFVELMKEMRNKNNMNPISENIHKYLSEIFIAEKKNYLSQDPGFIINNILEIIYNEINLSKRNNNPTMINPNINIYDEESVKKEFEEKSMKNSNIISDNLSSTLITKIKCVNCFQKNDFNFNREFQNHTQFKYEQIFVIDLFPPESYDPSKDLPPEDLKTVFYAYLLDDLSNKKYNEKCKKCGYKLNISKIVKSLKDYLIININRRYENDIKIKYPEKLDILDISQDNNKFQYELISVLADYNTNTHNLDNIDGFIFINNHQDEYKIFIKNFVDNKWYLSKINLQNQEINGNIEELINKAKPNLLIYKKI